ncbi:MAG TPA: dephospho-CoA kinase [Vicinamibacterales bacterium]|nr:dephospho-CoA kinase [Vicinamibacterales bacterium]
MRRVALTGGIATGKSHVRSQFESLGVRTIDADTLAHEVVAVGTPGLEAVVTRFGRAVLDRDGALDRRKLASIVFANADARRDLEHIIHPAVKTAIDAWFASLGQDVRFAIADIPLLYETGRDRDFEAVIVTACDPDTQLRRVMARDGVTAADARARIRAQLPMDEKVTRANYVIRTDGTIEETNAQVRAVHRALG